MTTTLRHNQVNLALHELRGGAGGASGGDGAGRALLLLHGLGERSPRAVPVEAERWPGPVAALDFTGHGLSTVPRGGGYTAEVLMADADAALAHLGQATVLGRGLGAYVALLLAGARAVDVRGVVLADGPGLAGGGAMPGSPSILFPDPRASGPPDPFAFAELTADVRPPDYASSFVRQATHLSGLAEPVTVAAHVRPQWLQAVVAEPGVRETPDVAAALAFYAEVR
jgi:pimeloyl-ACP methyl ester carboxylesterase